jgi:hypothetical protein
MVEGRGDALIIVVLEDGVKHIIRLRDTLYAPRSPFQLLSALAVTRGGASSGSIATPNDDRIPIEVHDGLYVMATYVTATALASSTLTLWHSRLGRLNFEDMKRLHTVAHGIPEIRRPMQHV